MEQTQLQAVWEQILTKMKETLAESAFKWFKSVKPLSLTDDGFVLSVQNDLVKDWITSHYLTIIEDAVSAVLGSKRKVDFLVLPSVQPEPEPEPAKSVDDELKEITEAVVSNLNAGQVTRSDLAQLLASFDVKKLTDLHESRYAEFRTAFLALL